MKQTKPIHIEHLLRKCVIESLNLEEVDLEKYSITPCAHSTYLDPNYDPFVDLEQRLMIQTLMSNRGVSSEDLSGI